MNWRCNLCMFICDTVLYTLICFCFLCFFNFLIFYILSWSSFGYLQNEIRIQNEDSYRFEQVTISAFTGSSLLCDVRIRTDISIWVVGLKAAVCLFYCVMYISLTDLMIEQSVVFGIILLVQFHFAFCFWGAQLW